jgi:hypothetical protein
MRKAGNEQPQPPIESTLATAGGLDAEANVMRPLLSPLPIDLPFTDLEIVSSTPQRPGLTQYISAQLAEKVIGLYVQYVSDRTNETMGPDPLMLPRYGNFTHVFICPLSSHSFAAETISQTPISSPPPWPY